MSWTATTNYNLKKVDYNTEENTWGNHLNDNYDIIDSLIKTLSEQLLPVGSIIPWHKSLPGTPSLDLAGTWVECNGQTLNDPESVYDGQIIPNENIPPAYDTGWINRSDWTQVQINVPHNLDAPLTDLLVKFLISPTGNDNDCFEAKTATWLSTNGGFTYHSGDNNNFSVHIHGNGFQYIQNGGVYTIDDQNWYYKIKVQKLSAPVNNFIWIMRVK